MTLARLAVVFTLAELADLASYLQAPHLEANPLVAGRDPAHAAALKVSAIALAWGLAALSPHWRPRSRAALELVLAAGIAWAAFAAGTNVATLAAVEASTSRSVQEPAPITREGTGFEEGELAPDAPGRTAAPSSAGAATPWPVLVSPPAARDDDVRPRHVRAPAVTMPAPTALPALAARRRGVASWYCCTRGFDAGDLVAAAGPALRVGHWRGRVVTVSANGRSIRVRLVDWCGCPGRRVIDLQPAAFARLAPLSRGLVDVVVRW